MRKTKIYIASPFTSGDKEQNVQLQMDACYHLLMLGFNPYMPVYHYFVHQQHDDMDVNLNIDWVGEIDLPWLENCDMAIRLHPKDNFGVEIPSPGADQEEAFCKEKGIPMFHFDTIEDMVKNIVQFSSEIVLYDAQL
jgi:nucleoside 2-deoxyribosyltransferase